MDNKRFWRDWIWPISALWFLHEWSPVSSAQHCTGGYHHVSPAQLLLTWRSLVALVRILFFFSQCVSYHWALHPEGEAEAYRVDHHLILWILDYLTDSFQNHYGKHQWVGGSPQAQSLPSNICEHPGKVDFYKNVGVHVSWADLIIRLPFCNKGQSRIVCWGNWNPLEYRWHFWEPFLTLWCHLLWHGHAGTATFQLLTGIGWYCRPFPPAAIAACKQHCAQ